MLENIIKVSSLCPIRTTLELIGGKWKLLIIFQLATRAMRLSELKRIIPDISEKMLIQELKNLVESNIVERQNFGEVPPRVEYKLTTTGHKIMPLIAEMRNFALEYRSEHISKTQND